ncbi:MAG: sugar phosphate nucleotidyltransferase [Candidatus Moranbacteria bacterium]|nr:sugar phosphate nucleotidyltransferase [Candidatus Moranbacteria bacterium]
MEKNKRRKPMKGIILAGGSAKRLFPNTIIVSKQLQSIYDRQMIFYPLNTLIKGGIRDILIITSPEHIGSFKNLLGDFLEDYGINISFKIQREPRGLPEAFVLGKKHIDDDNVTLILGDNVFEEDFSETIRNFESGGHIFIKEVSDPERFATVVLGDNGEIVEIVEKPRRPKSNYVSVGLYIYDNRVIKKAMKLKPSKRNEFEIVDLHKYYLNLGELKYTIADKNKLWMDAGTPDALLDAGIAVREKGIHKNFDPILEEAINRMCDMHKDLVDKRFRYMHRP